jgi:hypothetical protein
MLVKVYEKNVNLELHITDNDGYVITSKKTGLIYSLLEMVCYGGKATSDIVMIAIGNDTEGYIGMLDYIFGAHTDMDATLDSCLDIVDEFEDGLKKPLDIMCILEKIVKK